MQRRRFRHPRILRVRAGARWERTQHDPWLRLLEAARRRLRAAGIEAADSAPPRELAHLVAHAPWAAELRAPLSRWLLALERQRYAAPGSSTAPSLATLRRAFRQLRWPRPS